VLVFPRQTFQRLTVRPNWIVPIVFVVAAVIAKSLLSLGSGILDEALQAEAMQTGVDMEMVRQGAPMAFILSAVVGVPLVVLLQSLFFMAVGRLYGGYSSFKLSLSTIAYASVPVGVGALAAAALIPITHSPDLGADLTRLVDPGAQPFLWGAARELGAVPLWFYLLVGIAARPVLKLPKRRARLAAVTFAAIHILIMSWLGMTEARSMIDPMENWFEVETAHAVLHFPEETSDDAVGAARRATSLGEERVKSIAGAVPERIDLYFYSSVGQKERLTGNGAYAHSVTWANAVHVAWDGDRLVPLVREMAKVASARVLGKMYNPFVADGLATYAGAYWAGRPVSEAAAELMAGGEIPELRDLTDPGEYVALEPHAREIAAGSFTEFVIDEIGTGSYRELYSYVSRTRADVGAALERSLKDSLVGVENRWRSFIAVRDARVDGHPAD